MASDTVQHHDFAAPRDLVESFVADSDLRARWALGDAPVEVAGTGTGTRITVRSTANWQTAFEKLDDLVNALKGNSREIEILRVMKHPVTRVFAAFSDPAGMANWWGPDGFTTTTKSMDFRVGGSWDYMMHGPDGTDYPNFVRYTAIEKDAVIAYDHGTHAVMPAIFKAVISFTRDASETRVSLKVILGEAQERPAYVKFGAVEGGYQNLARLERWLDAHPLN